MQAVLSVFVIEPMSHDTQPMDPVLGAIVVPEHTEHEVWPVLDWNVPELQFTHPINCCPFVPAGHIVQTEAPTPLSYPFWQIEHWADPFTLV